MPKTVCPFPTMEWGDAKDAPLNPLHSLNQIPASEMPKMAAASEWLDRWFGKQESLPDSKLQAMKAMLAKGGQ